ncbi:hypothetical protein VTN77DRAFT_4680 [Rasamsonia byssochlamydoides]|uniref:uncharacterized protein n=1 Tax=Rasamsonia byssochlamydoides TaxID=89139 RepID=UPI003742D1CC
MDQPQLPTRQTAILTQPNLELGISHDVALPQLLEPDMVLIRVVAVALNPTDFKMPARFPSPGAIDGCDFAGVIVQLGPAVTRPLQVGDRVFGAVHGANPLCYQSGTFAEYVATSSEFLFVAPDWMSWETAAALGGAGIGTVGLALFCSMGLPATPEKPAEKPFYFLVNGGATATGTMAIQILRHCGVTPIATCSPKNFDLVKSYGAEQVFDYHSTTCADEIRKYTRNSLKYALDAITTPATMLLCCSALGRTGGKYTALELPPQIPGLRQSIKIDWVMGVTVFGKEIALGEGYYQSPNMEHYQFGLQWVKTIQGLIDKNALRSHPVRVCPGRFEGILQGLGLLKDGAVSAQKLFVKRYASETGVRILSDKL